MESEAQKCSWCGRPAEKCKKLIAGPGVNICDECVELCADILAADLQKEE